MTPAQLYAALDERRRQEGLKIWQLAVELDCTHNQLSRMRWGSAVADEVRERAEAWLRRPAPPQKE